MDVLKPNVTMQNADNGRTALSPSWIARTRRMVSLQRSPFIFGLLVVFFGLYYYRPEDFIKPLGYIPMAKITGGIAFTALLLSMMGGLQMKVPRAIKILWLMLVQLTMCIPFALWRGGAFQTVVGFAKGVVVAMLIGMAVVTVQELRKLLWIQVSAVALVTFLSIALRHFNPQGRLSGIQESILSNPNDLAINIAISFPLAMAFMLYARGLKKIVWAAALGVMILGVFLTDSRSGLLALILTILISIWEYGIKGKRGYLVGTALALLLLGMGIALSSSHYRVRVATIFVDEGVTGDSREARKELIKKSIDTALHHPFLGVGPGCFPMVDYTWKVAHNAYTELAAEAGIPALILFLMAMGAALKNIKQVRKSPWYEQHQEFRLVAQALWAGLVGYLAGSIFASTEYNFYPYFVIGYTCAMVRIADQPLPAQEPSRLHPTPSRKAYDRFAQPIATR